MAEKLIIAGSIGDAIGNSGDETVFLAGGTEINRLGSSVSASTLISVKKISGLREIYEEDGIVWIGSAVTFQEAAENEMVPEYFKEALLFMASRTKRNMATVGGNLALLRDDSYIVPCLLAARAKVVYKTSAAEELTCACKYLNGVKDGSIRNALILKIGLNASRTVFNKRYANTAMSHSVLNVSFGCNSEGKEIAIGAAIKNTGLHRLKEAEELIEKNPNISEGEIMEWAKKADFQIESDMYGSAEYKRYLLGTTIAKFAEQAHAEVGK